MPEEPETITRTWTIPLRDAVDVAVIGGGSAGIAAAAAVARNGVSSDMVSWAARPRRVWLVRS